IGACFIMLITTYLAHGVSRKTTVALLGTTISIVLTYALANLSMYFLQVNGSGGQDAYDLYLATNTVVDAKGLLLSGIIIATLGALNDVTVTQAATVFQLKRIKPDMTFTDLITHGFSVGREHASSMVNTVILAYAGSSLGVFFFFIINTKSQGYISLLNNEFIVEEVVKTLAGTLGILLAVPIVTVLAAYAVSKK
ncbi:MAG: YibE/F family protein, partial [Candidatus Levyibacteriota bacterium]